jgi:hypothetical protein
MSHSGIIGLLGAFLMSPFSTFGQAGHSSVPSPRPEEILSEALHQAIALEKLPDVSTLLVRDTIEVEAFLKADSLFEPMLPSFVPRHVDRWVVNPWNRETPLGISAEHGTHHLLVYVTCRGSSFTVELICQPHFAAIDRGKLLLKYEYENGVFRLVHLTRAYG